MCRPHGHHTVVGLDSLRRFEMEYTKAGVLAEINDVLDNEIMSSEQLLGELLGAMTDVELKENWDYIKRMWEIEDAE